MIVRFSNSAARGALILFAAACTAGLGYSSVRNALAAHYAELDTREGCERATRLEPTDPHSWYLLGRYWQYNLEEPNGQEAIRAYEKSLSLFRNSADVWSDLAMAYESENNLTAAREAFEQAQRAYPLSPEVSWRYGNFLLRRGELEPAFAKIRRAVEVDPKRGAAAFSLGMRVAPDISVVLDRVLPPLPEVYLSVVQGLAERQQREQALLVWSRLMGLHPRLQVTDANQLIELLVHETQMPAAERVWEQTLAASGTVRPPDPPGSLVWDGGFEGNLVNAGLAWRYVPVLNGVQIFRDAQEKHSGNYSLRLVFGGLSNVDLHDLCQYVEVQPATPYRFSAWVQTRSLSTDEGVRFSLDGIGAATSAAAFTEDVRGTQAWKQVQLAWLPAGDVHELRLCIARLPSAKFDSKIHGTAWVDDVVLVPEARERTAQ